MDDANSMGERKYGLLSLWSGVCSILLFFIAPFAGAVFADPLPIWDSAFKIYVWVGVLFLGALAGVCAIVLARKQRQRVPTRTATAGRICGNIGCALNMILLVVFLAVWVISISA